ncbi:MAG: ABC transporter permease subunit [Clostridia bacterium]|nr:ABC transporter permease subunit [Clostridia bacterium]
MSDKKKNANGTAEKKGFFATLGSWIKRMFFGGSKELSESEKFSVENIDSPSKMAVKAFFRRKLAVLALIVLVGLFLFVFIGPIFIKMDVNYTDANLANLPPNYTMLDVPSELEGNIKSISGFADFTVGVSNDNTLYIWGSTFDALSKVEYSAFPEEIKEGNVLYAAAGLDHIIAITTEGKIVGWGKNYQCQFGYKANEADPYIQMPEEFITGTIDPSKVSQLVCGYQCTALVYDGKLYVWGNPSGMLNMKDLVEYSNPAEGKEAPKPVKQVAISNYYAIALLEDGSVITGGQTFTFNRQSGYSNMAEGNKVANLQAHLREKKVINIGATKNCFAILCDDGELLIQGANQFGEYDVPALVNEKFVSVVGGTNHFVGVTDQGKAYAWGHNDGKQAEVYGEKASVVYAGAKQTYLVDENGELLDSTGFKGYLMGTDKSGRDVFKRIIYGGRMTMTVGAVAVIVSTVIAIIVGCLSGYFGGWVDMLLMRITEIFSAIPFLPFAMMLSYIIQKNPIGETARIVIIMIILGLLSWTGLARMIRAQILAEREKEFVLAAKAMGVKEKIIAFKHILPNVISVVLVSVTLDFATCMLTESSLSYLGFGVQQPDPTWGNMLNGANNSIVIQNYWWQWVFPAIFLSIATISINIIGDTLRDVLDPKSSQEK